MDTKTRIAAIMVAFAATGSGTPFESVEQPTTVVASYEAHVDSVVRDDSPSVGFHEGTQAQADKMLWAIDRFRDAGLELPSLEIYFAQNCQERFGAWGRIHMDTAPPWRVEACTTSVYLHELAHAWDRWNLTDTDRRMFLDLRGLDAWQGSDLPWEQRGEEELARLVALVLAQGVNNHPSQDQLTDLHDFEKITRVPAPVTQTINPTGTSSESPAY